MNKEDIINYVMTTPSNPNRAVLEGMLDDVENAGGTGSDVFVVTITQEDPESTTATADKTLAEIQEAFNQGKFIKGRFSYGESGWIETITEISADETSFNIGFRDRTLAQDVGRLLISDTFYEYDSNGITVNNDSFIVNTVSD